MTFVTPPLENHWFSPFFNFTVLRPPGIASTGIFPTEDGTYDIGYCVHKRKWQQGFGTEIVALLLEWLKNHGANKVMAEVAMDNLPSNLLLQKFGFAVEKQVHFKNII